MVDPSPKKVAPRGATRKSDLAVGQKCVPKMACPGKWNQGLQPAVPWWLNFHPYPSDYVSYLVDPKIQNSLGVGAQILEDKKRRSSWVTFGEEVAPCVLRLWKILKTSYPKESGKPGPKSEVSTGDADTWEVRKPNVSMVAKPTLCVHHISRL